MDNLKQEVVVFIVAGVSLVGVFMLKFTQLGDNLSVMVRKGLRFDVLGSTSFDTLLFLMISL